MQAVTAEKPKATPDIVTDEDAYFAHQADIEVWGTSISLAGGRLCRWFVTQGAEWDFCPPAPSPETPQD